MTHTSSTATTARTSATKFRYRTVDLVMIVMIGVAFGVAFVGYAHLYTLIEPLTTAFPPIIGILTGFWCIPAALAMLIVRKPGAALGAEMIAALFEPLLGSKFSWGAVVSGFLQGIGFEIALAMVSWGAITLPALVAGALMSTTFEWVYEVFAYYPEWTLLAKIFLLIMFSVSSIIFLVVLAPALVKALAATGALNSFAPGREHAALATQAASQR